MSYLVLARKWRPKTFSEVVGQQHVLRALINGLEQNRLHHAFLFAGTRGVGKTTLARILAKSLNCEAGVSAQPCGQCPTCQDIDTGHFVDLIEVDAASRTKVDDTRELLDNVQYAPSRGRYKVYLIDEVHMLSVSSFNALLKTLEEPPPHVKFLFATTDPQKLPVTILSRCLQFNLRRLEPEQIADHLAFILQQENLEFEPAALTAIAQAADGSMRDALSVLDQAIAFGAGRVTYADVTQMLGTIEQDQIYQILTALIDQDAEILLAQSDELYRQGRDFTVALDALLSTLQRMAACQYLPDSDQANSAPLPALLRRMDAETIQLMYQIALHGKRDLPYAADPKSGFTMTLLRMLSFQPMQTAPVPAEEATKKKPLRPQKAKHAPPSLTPSPAPDNASENTMHQSDEPAPLYTSSPLLHADNWLSVVDQITLKGLARQFADNAHFIKFDAPRLYLSLTDQYRHLATDKTIERLESALKKQLNVAIEIVINNTDLTATTQQTRAVQQAKQRAQKQQHAIESIRQDPLVQALTTAFDGQVIENSIKPLN